MAASQSMFCFSLSESKGFYFCYGNYLLPPRLQEAESRGWQETLICHGTASLWCLNPHSDNLFRACHPTKHLLQGAPGFLRLSTCPFKTALIVRFQTLDFQAHLNQIRFFGSCLTMTHTKLNVKNLESFSPVLYKHLFQSAFKPAGFLDKKASSTLLL